MSFLSGLNSIDFQGLTGLGGIISGAAAADLVWTEMPWGTSAVLAAKSMSPEQFKAKVSQALSTDYRMTLSPNEMPAGVLDNSVLTSQYPDNADVINTVLETLKGKGYYIVSAKAAAPVQAPPAQSTAPAQTSSIAYQGAVAAQQAGSTRVAATQQTPTTQSSPVQIQRQGRPATRYIRQAHKQTPAERQRLMWIIGGFSVLFVMAIGVIAARE